MLFAKGAEVLVETEKWYNNCVRLGGDEKKETEPKGLGTEFDNLSIMKSKIYWLHHLKGGI